MKFDIEARPTPRAAAFPQPRASSREKRPERMAWLVIFGAFAACLLLTLAVPLTLRYFLLYTAEPRSGTVEAISLTQEGSGTVRLTLPNATVPIAVTADPAPLYENSLIETDQTSRAFVTFFDGSTVQVSPGTRLLVHEMRRPRFQWSELPNTIKIDQTRGGPVRYGVALPVAHSGNPDGRAVTFIVHTPSFDVSLNAGSYSIEVSTGDSQVVVREGSATVRSLEGENEVAVGQGQRLQVAGRGQPLPSPIPAAQDLISNGDFSGATLNPKQWQAFSDQGGDGGNVNGSVGVVTIGDRPAVQILRSGSEQNSAITGIRQAIEKEVSYFSSMVLSADVRLHNQSLSGGGYQSSEYPLIIRITYSDVNGSQAEYVHGFYYQNDQRNPTKDGERIPQDQWVPFETGNLLEGLDPKPFRILSISIYASGWDYESYISGVRLTVE